MSLERCISKQEDTTTPFLEQPKCRTQTIPNVGEDVEQQEFSVIPGGNIKQWKFKMEISGKQFSGFLQNQTNPYYMVQRIHLSIYPKKLKTYIHTKICTWMFMVALFIIAQTQKQPIYPPLDEWINNRNPEIHG